jgi:streptomycin 3"-adenylyltransferase
MAHCNYYDAPPTTRAQLDRLSAALDAILGAELVGIYLHGSLAMGSFNPLRSDLDLLVIVATPMALETKREVASALLGSSAQPHPIEISFCTPAQLHPWRHPTPFDLHYSEDWRAKTSRELADGTWRQWNNAEPRDADLAAHIMVTRARGIVLRGAPIDATLPEVPASDYRASVVGDVAEALATIEAHPVYAILNACRTLAYLREGHVFSKAEGGRWGLQALPAALHPLIAAALAAYAADAGDPPFPPGALAEFAAALRTEFRSVV